MFIKQNEIQGRPVSAQYYLTDGFFERSFQFFFSSLYILIMSQRLLEGREKRIIEFHTIQIPPSQFFASIIKDFLTFCS